MLLQMSLQSEQKQINGNKFCCPNKNEQRKDHIINDNNKLGKQYFCVITISCRYIPICSIVDIIHYPIALFVLCEVSDKCNLSLNLNILCCRLFHCFRAKTILYLLNIFAPF